MQLRPASRIHCFLESMSLRFLLALEAAPN